LSKAFSSSTWNEALQGFLLHLQATRARKTVQYYQTLLKALMEWADRSDVPLEKLGKRQMDAYLVFRLDAGRSQTTLHHYPKPASCVA